MRILDLEPYCGPGSSETPFRALPAGEEATDASAAAEGDEYREEGDHEEDNEHGKEGDHEEDVEINRPSAGGGGHEGGVEKEKSRTEPSEGRPRWTLVNLVIYRV